jgi:hypothetical protein
MGIGDQNEHVLILFYTSNMIIKKRMIVGYCLLSNYCPKNAWIVFWNIGIAVSV